MLQLAIVGPVFRLQRDTPRWACHLCPNTFDALVEPEVRALGINIHFAYDETYGWQEKLCPIDRWVSHTLEASPEANPLVPVLAEPDLRAVSSHLMAQYWHGVLGRALADIKGL